MAAERNIYVRQGDTFTHALILWDGYDAGGSKIPADIDGYSFHSDIRRSGETHLSPAGDEVLASFSASVDANIVTLVLSSSDSNGVPPGRHWYDVEAISPEGKVFTYISGEIIFLPRVA
jgi:hypothetical protein